MWGSQWVRAARRATPQRVHPPLSTKACLSRSSAKVSIKPSHDTQRTLGRGRVHPSTVVLTIKCTTFYGRICTMTTLGREGDATFIVVLDYFLNFLLSVCVLIHVDLLGFLSLVILSTGNFEFKTPKRTSFTQINGDSASRWLDLEVQPYCFCTSPLSRLGRRAVTKECRFWSFFNANIPISRRADEAQRTGQYYSLQYKLCNVLYEKVFGLFTTRWPYSVFIKITLTFCVGN